MADSRPTVHLERTMGRPGHGTVHRDLTTDWDRAFGAVAFGGGLLLLLTSLPLLIIGVFLGVVLLTGSLLCAARVLPGRTTTALAMGGLALMLFMPLTGALDLVIEMYRLFAGVVVTLFGIVKLT